MLACSCVESTWRAYSRVEHMFMLCYRLLKLFVFIDVVNSHVLSGWMNGCLLYLIECVDFVSWMLLVGSVEVENCLANLVIV